MDFDSWRPEDSARRFALLVACCVGVFAFIGLWLGIPLNFFLSVLLGGVGGFLVYWLTYPIFLNVYRR